MKVTHIDANAAFSTNDYKGYRVHHLEIIGGLATSIISKNLCYPVKHYGIEFYRNTSGNGRIELDKKYIFDSTYKPDNEPVEYLYNANVELIEESINARQD